MLGRVLVFLLVRVTDGDQGLKRRREGANRPRLLGSFEHLDPVSPLALVVVRLGEEHRTLQPGCRTGIPVDHFLQVGPGEGVVSRVERRRRGLEHPLGIVFLLHVRLTPQEQ